MEDAAHALAGTYRGPSLGGFGDLATLSFHETKHLQCGEGGALLVNRPDLVERAEIAWAKGTDRLRFDRGEVDRYQWVGPGGNHQMSDLSAAFLLG